MVIFHVEVSQALLCFSLSFFHINLESYSRHKPPANLRPCRLEIELLELLSQCEITVGNFATCLHHYKGKPLFGANGRCLVSQYMTISMNNLLNHHFPNSLSCFGCASCSRFRLQHQHGFLVLRSLMITFFFCLVMNSKSQFGFN